jgi:hypothetical protein
MTPEERAEIIEATRAENGDEAARDTEHLLDLIDDARKCGETTPEGVMEFVLATWDVEIPPLEDDPIAIMLGIVPPKEP